MIHALSTLIAKNALMRLIFVGGAVSLSPMGMELSLEKIVPELIKHPLLRSTAQALSVLNLVKLLLQEAEVEVEVEAEVEVEVEAEVEVEVEAEVEQEQVRLQQVPQEPLSLLVIQPTTHAKPIQRVNLKTFATNNASLYQSFLQCFRIKIFEALKSVTTI